MRTKIKEKLVAIDTNVYYGIVPDIKDRVDYNFLVFGQEKLSKSGTSLNDINGYWYVTIVRENFIPDDLVSQVIESLTSIKGLRLANGDHIYEYLRKGNTSDVIESLTLSFTRIKDKGC